MRNNITARMATILGIAAIFMWFTVFAFSRSLAEQLGTLTASAATYLVGGGLGSLGMIIQYGGFGILNGFSKRYLCVCGGFFILYIFALNLAIGWAANRQQAIEVVIINYLWPAFTMIFFISILKYRVRMWIIPGIAVAVVGVCFAVTSGTQFTFQVLVQNIQTNCLPYGLAIIAAVAWSLYSSFNRRFAAQAPRSAIPVFIFLCGIICLCISIMSDEHSAYKLTTIFELLYVAIFPNLLAYIFWDITMRKGNAVLVTSISYLSPLCSSAVTALYLHVPLGMRFWFAAAMVIAGAVICNMSISQQKPVEG